MKADDGFIYWVDVDENEEFIEPFDKYLQIRISILRKKGNW